MIATRSPPSVTGLRARALPPCTSAIEATIESPSPAPLSEPVRSAPRRRNGWVSCFDAGLVEDRAAVLDDQARALSVDVRR